MHMTSTMNFKIIFETLVDFFGKSGIDYAIIGAFALKAYGYARATSDVDFIVRVKDQEPIVSFVESLGFETLHRSTSFSNHVHPISSLGRLDFVYVAGSTGDEIFRSARRLVVFKDRELPVASPEHIVALKVFAMKNDPERLYREMADIEALMKKTNVSKDTVKKYFKKWNLLDLYFKFMEGKSEP